jgi:hypothetical protein
MIHQCVTGKFPTKPEASTASPVGTWTDDEITEWYARRPTGPGVVKGVCARLKAEKAARLREHSQQEAAS